MGLELSSASLAIRVILGVVLAALTFLVFYYVPANLASIVSGHVPSNSAASASSVTSSLIGSTLPIIGLVLSVLVFLDVVLRGSSAYGVTLILTGLLFAAYTYTALHGGTIGITLPGNLTQGATGDITIDVGLLMLVLLIPSLLTVVKGVLLLAVKR
jgi:hypothetical protein